MKKVHNIYEFDGGVYSILGPTRNYQLILCYFLVLLTDNSEELDISQNAMPLKFSKEEEKRSALKNGLLFNACKIDRLLSTPLVYVFSPLL